MLTPVMLLAACGGDDGENGAAEDDPRRDPGAITVTDYTKAEIAVDQPAERIVCLYGACVDAMAELGLKPVAMPGELNSEVAGRPEYFGDDASSIPKLGGDFFEPDLEDIAAAEPDLVIGAACFHDALRDALEPVAPLILLDLGGYELAMENLRLIGRATGREDAAESAIDKLEARIDAYAAKSPKALVPVDIYPTTEAPLIDSTSSQGGSLLSRMGPFPWPAFQGDSCLGGGQVTYSLEKVLEVNPDVMFVIRNPMGDRSVRDFEGHPVWSQLKAVANDRVYEVDSTTWSLGGTRSAALVLDEAMTKMYPDVFPEPLPD
ncbi:MAG: ABC transporter substrate-binding protein [Acidimicrobiales bacterium]